MTDIKPRNLSADLLKVLAIYGVVFIHGAAILSPDEMVETRMTEFFRYCVPVFILLWSYFFELSLIRGKKLLDYAWDRFIKLFWPYLIWSVIYFFLIVDFNDFVLSDLVSGYWSGYGWAGQYFFIILFQLIPMFGMFRWLAGMRKNMVYLVMGLFFIFYIISCYYFWSIRLIMLIGDRLFIYWVPYVLLGILAARTKIFNIINIKPWLVICLMLLVPLEFHLLYKLGVSHSAYVVPTVLISAIGLTFSIMHIDLNQKRIPGYLGKAIGLISGNTLGIFCINPMVCILLRTLIPREQITSISNPLIVLISPMFSALLVLSLSLTITLLLKRFGMSKIVVS